MKRSIHYVFLIFFCIFFLIIPIIPDVQISRPKLLIIEILSYILFAVFLLYSIIENKIVFKNNKFLVVLFLFLSYIILRYIFSSQKPIAYNELKRWCLSIWLLYAVSLIEKKYYKLLLNFLILGSFLAVVYGFLQHYGRIWIFEVPKFERVMSMFGNPIFFAVHIINVLPMILGMYIVEFNKKIKFLYFLIFVISLITLYYTKTRAAFLGLFFAAIFFIYTISNSKEKLKYLFVLSTIFLIFIFLTKDIWLRQQAHFLIWRDSLKMWLSRPFLGVGLGRFHIEFVSYASEELRKIWPERNFIINDAHNEYIQFLVENGVFGFVLFILVIFLFFRFSLQYLKKTSIDKEQYEIRMILISLLSSCIAVLVQNFLSVDLRFIISNIYLFITMGFVVGYTSNICEKRLIFDNLIIRIIFVILAALFLGIFSFSKKNFFSILSFLHITPQGIKLQITDDNTNGLFQYILKPYLANYKLQQEKDFFDEKIVNAAKTLQELEKLKKQFPNKSIIYERIAWIYAKEKQFDKAIENYLQAIKLNSNSYSAYNNLGNIMFVLNNIEKAIEFYKKSIDIEPNQIDARLNLGIAYYYQGKINLAIEQFNKVLKIDPNNEKAIVYIKKIRE